MFDPCFFSCFSVVFGASPADTQPSVVLFVALEASECAPSSSAAWPISSVATSMRRLARWDSYLGLS